MKRLIICLRQYAILLEATYILYSSPWNVRSSSWNIRSSPWNIHSSPWNVKLIRLFREINAACGINMSVLFTINWKLNVIFAYR